MARSSQIFPTVGRYYGQEVVRRTCEEFADRRGRPTATVQNLQELVEDVLIRDVWVDANDMGAHPLPVSEAEIYDLTDVLGEGARFQVRP